MQITWWLILVGVLVAVVALVVNVYIVVAYSSPLERSKAWFPKTITVLALCLAWSTVLLLPYDVANRMDPTALSPSTAGLNTALMWQIVLWSDAAMVVVVLPFATFYYEAWDPEQYSVTEQLGPAFVSTIIITGIFGGLCAVLWTTEGVAVLPYWSYSAPPQLLDPLDPNLLYYDSRVAASLSINVSFFVYVVGLLIFVGWVLFCIYGGVGLVAVPVDLMRAFHNRPKPLSTDEFRAVKERIASNAERFQREANQMLRDTNGSKRSRKKINSLAVEVRRLEKELDMAIVAYEDRGFGPIKASLIMLASFMAGSISLAWILQIFLYNATDTNPFLNTMLIALYDAFALLGIGAYAMFSFYLAAVAVHGCFKVGVRLPFFHVHPMRLGDTLINTLLFNAGLVLLMSVVVTQFCAFSFDLFVTFTSLEGLLNLWVMHLKGIGVALSYFQFALIGVSVLTAVWFYLCPHRRRRANDTRTDEEED